MKKPIFLIAAFFAVSGGVAGAYDANGESKTSEMEPQDEYKPHYLVDPTTGIRVLSANALPGRVYDVYDKRLGNSKPVARWRKDADGRVETMDINAYPRPKSVVGGFFRGIKQGWNQATDSITHGIPAMVGDEAEDIAEFHELQTQRRREYEVDTPMHEQVSDSSPLFGRDGTLTVARIAKFIGHFIGQYGILIPLIVTFWEYRKYKANKREGENVGLFY